MGAYYIIVCMILGYAAYYLGSAGFSSWETGSIVSGSCLAGGLLQGAAGRLADKNPDWSWKKQLAAYSLLALVISVMKIFIRGHLWNGVSFGLIIVLTMVMMPLVNSAVFYYENHGIDVDYGIARGTGSVAYAAASFVLGRLTAARGADAMLFCCAAAFSLMLQVFMITTFAL